MRRKLVGFDSKVGRDPMTTLGPILFDNFARVSARIDNWRFDFERRLITFLFVFFSLLFFFLDLFVGLFAATLATCDQQA